MNRKMYNKRVPHSKSRENSLEAPEGEKEKPQFRRTEVLHKDTIQYRIEYTEDGAKFWTLH